MSDLTPSSPDGLLGEIPQIMVQWNSALVMILIGRVGSMCEPKAYEVGIKAEPLRPIILALTRIEHWAS